MSKERRSSVWKISKVELQELINKSSTLTDICNIIGIKMGNGSVKTLYRRFKEEEFDFTQFRINRKIFLSSRKPKFNIVWDENSPTGRNVIKRFIIKNNTIPYECFNCKNIGSWFNKTLSLQLEHKNGLNNDNRLENLCFLCPNCHSQTATYAGRNSKNTQDNVCFVERTVIQKESSEKKKLRFKKARKFEVEENVLKKLVEDNIPFTTIGKMFGVSDNAIRKRCRTLNINVPKKHNRSLR